MAWNLSFLLSHELVSSVALIVQSQTGSCFYLLAIFIKLLCYSPVFCLLFELFEIAICSFLSLDIPELD